MQICYDRSAMIVTFKSTLRLTYINSSLSQYFKKFNCLVLKGLVYNDVIET